MHKFSNSDKINALSTWIDRMQAWVDSTKEAIQDADTMDRWPHIPDDIRDDALEKALKACRQFAGNARRLLEHYDQFRIPHEDYGDALKIASEITDFKDADGWQSFRVPVWASDRIIRSLKNAKIKFWIND